MLPAQSLQVSAFDPVVEKQPINVHYQKYTADSFSSSSVSFNVDSPFAGALLDNEVLIEYQVQVKPHNNVADEGLFGFKYIFEGGTAQAGGLNPLGNIPHARTDGRVALAEGFAVHNSLSSVSLTINGQTITQTPRKWMGEFMRFYASPHEEKSVCSMSGGEFDSGNFSNRTKDAAYVRGDPTLAVAVTPTSVHSGYGVNARTAAFAGGIYAVPGAGDQDLRSNFPAGEEEWYNAGFSKRFYRMGRHARHSAATGVVNSDNLGPEVAAATNASRYADFINFTVYERVPASPFLLWDAKDGKHSIPYVDKMELDLRYESDMSRHSLQGLYRLATNAVSVLTPLMSFLGTDGTSAPILHLKWYIPPAGMVMAPQVSIPIQKIKELTLAQTSTPVIAAAGFESPAVDFSYSNIRLQQIPDLLFVYARLQPSALTGQKYTDALETHLELSELRITVNGDSGKMLQASIGRLFSLYLKNSPMARERDYDYQEWRKRYCTAVLTPEDMGVLQPPGINHGVTLDVLASVKSHWVFPRVGRTAVSNLDVAPGRAWDLQIMAVYDKYELTLTNRGNAQLKLLNVPSPDVAPQVAAPDRADLAQAFA